MVPIIHKIQNLYKEVYRIGSKIPKRDKLGIHAKVESVILEILSLAIAAAFTPREKKKPTLESARVKTEIAKQLIRVEQEIHSITEASYFALEGRLQEISKEITKWSMSLP